MTNYTHKQKIYWLNVFVFNDYSKQNCRPSLNQSKAAALYLVHFIPLGVQILFDGLAFEIAVADSERCVRVRLALHQTHHVRVFGHQVPALQQVDPDHPLHSRTNQQSPHLESRFNFF